LEQERDLVKSVPSVVLSHEKDLLYFNPFLQADINFLTYFVPLANGSLITISKYFYNILLRSYINYGLLFVFVKKCVLGN
jgi:uncharacterized protein involved in cysteine biosynthesis